MQQEEQYTLTWQNYSDHLRDNLREMMLSGEFTDVTLVTDDKQQMRAHRNILSACSQVFKNILQMDFDKTNPVIYLRGIQHAEMESILQFIYLGNTRIHEERMNEFFMVSKNLEIKQLLMAINDQTSSDEASNGHETNVVEDKDHAQTFINNFSNVEQQTQTSTRQINRNNVAEKRMLISEENKYTCNQCDQQFTQQNILTHHIKFIHEGFKYTCKQCDYQSEKPSNLAVHIQSIHELVKYTSNQNLDIKQIEHKIAENEDVHLEDHSNSLKEYVEHQTLNSMYPMTENNERNKNNKQERVVRANGVKFSCNLCDKQFTQKISLKRHIQSEHEGIRYACNQCDYQATQKGSLKTHVQSLHECVKYACNQCDSQYKYPSDLTQHIKSQHHEGVKYTCNQCDKQCTTLNNLRTHIKSKHKVLAFINFDHLSTKSISK